MTFDRYETSLRFQTIVISHCLSYGKVKSITGGEPEDKPPD